jgi:serine O-acetyltransferase
MTFNEYKYLIRSDLYRITGEISNRRLLRYFLSGEAFKYNIWMRGCVYTQSQPVLKYTIYPIVQLMLKRIKYKLGISIPSNTQIGSGFYIGHFGGITINGQVVIGNNVNISQGVTLGESCRGKNKGCPTIGNNVYIAPGVVIFGAINIGNNVAIGANCVVTKDVPDNSVVVGIPAKVISQQGAEDYILNTDYQDKLMHPPRS